VIVDAELRTHNPRIWAAGDATGHSQFVYVAGAQGALIADNAFGHAGCTLDYTLHSINSWPPTSSRPMPARRRDCSARTR
jgi:pyruvate/2-oxoglutarate dehydrogenase complex dihydrolipoamide dehydrogenase (E3) component